MSDLIEKLEAWTIKQSEEHAMDSVTCDWENGGQQVLDLLRPVIEAADDVAYKDGNVKMHNALAGLRKKLEDK